MSFSRSLASLVLMGWAALLNAGHLSFRARELPWAAIGNDYRAAIQTLGDGRCPLGDVVLSVVEGVLPEGLILQGDTVAGIPKQMGIFRFRLRAANNCAAAEQVFQLQVTGRPILRLAPGELVFEYRIGDPAPKPRNVLVSSTWPELSYTVTGAPNWLRVQLRAGATPPSGSAFSSDAATVEVVPQDLKPGVYEAALVFFARQGDAPPAVPVKIKVSAAATAVTTVAQATAPVQTTPAAPVQTTAPAPVRPAAAAAVSAAAPISAAAPVSAAVPVQNAPVVPAPAASAQTKPSPFAPAHTAK